MWNDGIIKLAIETLDYGKKLGEKYRYDYRIATIHEDGHIDNIPVRYDSKSDAVKRLKELAKQIDCEIGEGISSIAEIDSKKQNLLNKRKQSTAKQKMHTTQYLKNCRF